MKIFVFSEERWETGRVMGLSLIMTLEVKPPVRHFTSVSKSSIQRFVITEKAFSWLKAATTAFTFKTLLRHYAEWALTPQSLNVTLGPRHNYHEGRAAIRHYSNQPL